MSFLKQKSEFNIQSAKELIELTYYAPSVHCSYYASFQFMKYSLQVFRKISYDQIETDCRNSEFSTHVFIINNILQELSSKITAKFEFQNLSRKIKDLKAFRIKSDYHNSQIINEEAKKSLEFSEEIIKTIKNYV